MTGKNGRGTWQNDYNDSANSAKNAPIGSYAADRYLMSTLAAHPNPLLNTDFFKASHWCQYPSASTGMFSYVEARGGTGEYPRVLFFGLQALIQENLSTPITHAMVDEAAAVFRLHGQPFHEAGWRRIVDVFGGRLPLHIRAVDEGTVLPPREVLATIESTDPASFWLVSYIETWLLRVWYPVTVATQSWTIKQIIRDFLERTADPVDEVLPLSLHDLGARGATSTESAGLGGCAHLCCFDATDSVQAVLAATRYYDSPQVGQSLPGADHSTITSWGRTAEPAACRRILQQFGQPGSRFAAMADSYDLWQALAIWGEQLKQELVQSGSTLIVRPDSGTPASIVLRTAAELERHFGSTTNSKGYRVLNQVRILQGDGINRHTIREILANLALYGYASDNISFGIGGALLQQFNRDTLGFAMKCSAIRIDGQWTDVWKEPATDPGKTSRRGRLSLFRHRSTGQWRTLPIDDGGFAVGEDSGLWEDQLHTVYYNGSQPRRQTLNDIRRRADEVRGLPNASRIGSQGFLLF